MRKSKIAYTLVYLLTAQLAVANSPTWTGQGVDEYWKTPGNWQDSSLPSSDASITFGPLSGTQANAAYSEQISGLSIYQLSINRDSVSPFTISGTPTSPIPLGPFNGANPTITITFPNATTACPQLQNMQLNAPTTLSFIGSNTNPTPTKMSSVSGPGSLTLSSDANPFTVELQSNSYAGGTVMQNAGTFVLTDSTGFGDAAGNIDLQANLTIQAKGAVNLANSFILSSGAVNELTFSVDSGCTLQIAKAIENPGSAYAKLNKFSSGTLLLTGNNAYAGATYLKAGTLMLGHNNALGIDGNLEMSNDTILSVPSGSDFETPLVINAELDKNNDIEIEIPLNSTLKINGSIGNLTLTKDLKKTGRGTLSLPGKSYYTGMTVLKEGTIQIGDNEALANRNIQMSNGTILQTQSGGEYQLYAQITGENSGDSITFDTNGSTLQLSGVIGTADDLLSLNKVGAGTLYLDSENSYSGETYLQGGTLRIGNNQALNSADLYIHAGAVIQVDHESEGIILENNIIGVGPATSGNAILFDTIGTDLSLNGSISESSNSIGIIKSGDGFLTITKPSTYTGTTLVEKGGLSIGNNTSLGTGEVQLTSNSVLSFGGFSYRSPSPTLANNLKLVGEGTGTIDIDSAGIRAELSGVISESGGAKTLQKVGDNRLTLSNANTYSGGTILSNGNLVLGNESALGQGEIQMKEHTGLIIQENKGPFTLANSITGIGSQDSNQLTIDTNGSNLTLSGIISEKYKPSYLYKDGDGTLFLTKQNSYSGGTIVHKGILSIGVGASIGSGPVTLDGGSLITYEGTTITTPVEVTEDISITTNDPTGSTVVTGPVNGSPNTTLTLEGAGTNSVSTVVVDSGTFTIGGNIGGSQTVTKEGDGTLILTGNPTTGGNTYTGGTIISDGTVQISTGSQLGSGTVTIEEGTLAIVPTSPEPVTIINPITVINTSTELGAGTISSSGTTVITGPITGTNGAILTLETTGNGTNSISAVIVNNNDQFTIGGNIGGGQTVTKEGDGTLILTGNPTTGGNTYTGGTTIHDGTVQISTGSQLGKGMVTIGEGTLAIVPTSPDPVTIINPITVINTSTNSGAGTISSSGTTVITGPITGTNGAILNLITTGAGSNSISHVSVNNADQFTINGVITGTQPFTKDGSGTVTLNGSGSLLGPITVAAGQMAIKGSFTAPTVHVAAEAIFSGSGTINQDVTIYGTLVTDPELGSMTIGGNYTHKSGSTLKCIINPVEAAPLIVHQKMTIEENTNFILSIKQGLIAYKDGQQYEIIKLFNSDESLTADMGANQFLAVQPDPLTPLIGGHLTYNQSGVTLTLDLKTITPTPSAGNGGAVENALNSIGATGDPSVNGIIDSLLALPVLERASALSQLQPSLYKGMTVVQQNNAMQVITALSERGKGELENQTLRKQSHLWAIGIGEFLKQDSTTLANSSIIGYGSKTGGFVAGIDYQPIKILTLGALSGYTQSFVTWDANRGKGVIESGYGGFYLSARNNLVFGNLSVLGIYSEFNAQRDIIYATKIAKSSYRGNQCISHADVGLNFAGPNVAIQPFNSVDLILGKERDYVETEADEYNLAISKTYSTLWRNELGTNVIASSELSFGLASLEAKLSWVKEIRKRGEGLEAEFVISDVPAPFKVNGYFPTRNLLSVGTSANLSTYKNGLDFSVYYKGTFGHKYSNHGIGGQISHQF